MYEEQGRIAAWLLSLHELGPFPSKQSAIQRIHEEWEELDNAVGAENLAKELADVVITCMALASMMNIDIQKFVQEKIAINNKRKWRQDPKTLNYYHIKETV